MKWPGAVRYFLKLNRVIGGEIEMNKKANILLLFSDQHKASVLGCEGHSDVMTPNIDRLANEGLRFSRAYSQDAICVPSRSSMITGLYPRSIGCFSNDDRSTMMAKATSMQKTFQANGYRTGAFGKRHIFSECDEGWDVKAGHFYSENPEDNYVSWINEQGYGSAFARDWATEFGKCPNGMDDGIDYNISLMSTQVSELPETMTMEAFTKTRALQFMEECHEQEQPFFCFASFYRPHQPYTPLKAYMDMYPHDQWGAGVKVGSTIRMPETLHQAVEELPPYFRDQHNGTNRVWRLDLARKDEQLYRSYIAAYYALVTEIDSHVGDIMSAIKEMGITEETIIIYTSDHGDFVGSHGMVEKCASGHNVYEDTLRVPMIIKWDGIKAKGLKRDELVELVDLYPTLVDLCGLDGSIIYQELQGKTIRPLLDNSVCQPFRVSSVSENNAQITVITDRYKYGHWKIDNGEKDMLFDMKADPLEISNLISDDGYLEVVEKMKRYLKEFEDQIPSISVDECGYSENHTL